MIFYTYVHTRADDGRVFYVGKGQKKRAWKFESRSSHWKNVAAKHGVQVDIAARWETEQEAFEHERLLVACFRDMGQQLVNQTDGGEGWTGARHSAEWRMKIGLARRGKPGTPHTEESKKKLSEAAKGNTIWVGRKHRPESIAKRTAARLGRGKMFQEGDVILSRRGWADVLGLHESTIDYRLKTGKTPSGKPLK